MRLADLRFLVAASLLTALPVHAQWSSDPANNLAVAIPCHRVVRNNGALSGYAWGIHRKRQLLDLEAAHTA